MIDAACLNLLSVVGVVSVDCGADMFDVRSYYFNPSSRLVCLFDLSFPRGHSIYEILYGVIKVPQFLYIHYHVNCNSYWCLPELVRSVVRCPEYAKCISDLRIVVRIDYSQVLSWGGIRRESALWIITNVITSGIDCKIPSVRPSNVEPYEAEAPISTVLEEIVAIMSLDPSPIDRPTPNSINELTRAFVLLSIHFSRLSISHAYNRINGHTCFANYSAAFQNKFS